MTISVAGFLIGFTMKNSQFAVLLVILAASFSVSGQDATSVASADKAAEPPPQRTLGQPPAKLAGTVAPGPVPAGAAPMPVSAPPTGKLGTMPPAGKPPIGTPPPSGKGPLGGPVKAKADLPPQ